MGEAPAGQHANPPYLDAGADPATVARWITETEAERARRQAAKRAAPLRAIDEP